MDFNDIKKCLVDAEINSFDIKYSGTDDIKTTHVDLPYYYNNTCEYIMATGTLNSAHNENHHLNHIIKNLKGYIAITRII